MCGSKGGNNSFPDNPFPSSGLCCDQATKRTVVGDQKLSNTYCKTYATLGGGGSSMRRGLLAVEDASDDDMNHVMTTSHTMATSEKLAALGDEFDEIDEDDDDVATVEDEQGEEEGLSFTDFQARAFVSMSYTDDSLSINATGEVYVNQCVDGVQGSLHGSATIASVGADATATSW